MKKPITIIGAGITGLILANTLCESGYQVCVIDKGRGVGGRLATRRWTLPEVKAPQESLVRWDHGAQYFTAKGPSFNQLVAEWATNGWSHPWEAISSVESPRWVADGGMTQLCKHLATGLEIILSDRIIRLTHNRDHWTLALESGKDIQSSHVVITAPVPQILELLGQSQLLLTPDQASCLGDIQYQPCIGLLGVSSAQSVLPQVGYATEGNPVLAWVADNHAKGISPASIGAYTAHAAPEWSKQHWYDDDESLESHLKSALADWIPEQSWQHTMIKRWRYALVSNSAKQPYSPLTELPNLWAAGDGFVSGKVEGAVTSALALASHLIEEVM